MQNYTDTVEWQESLCTADAEQADCEDEESLAQARHMSWENSTMNSGCTDSPTLRTMCIPPFIDTSGGA